jgi:hypothetical protein
MSKINSYFIAHRTVTLALMWTFFAIALIYALVSMLLVPTLNFWFMFIPGLIALYFRIMDSKASYDPKKDKFSGEYVPYSERPENQKRKKKKK